MKIGLQVVVDGFQKRGVIKKKVGRKVYIEFPGGRSKYDPDVTVFDQNMVHPLE